MNISHIDDWQVGRVYSVTTDPKRVKSVQKRKPRTRMIASECISIMPDGSRKIIAQASYAKVPTRSTTPRKSAPKISKRAQVDIALMSTMGTIHTEA